MVNEIVHYYNRTMELVSKFATVENAGGCKIQTWNVVAEKVCLLKIYDMDMNGRQGKSKIGARGTKAVTWRQWQVRGRGNMHPLSC